MFVLFALVVLSCHVFILFLIILSLFCSCRLSPTTRTFIPTTHMLSCRPMV